MSTLQPLEAGGANIAALTRRIRSLGRLPSAWVKSGENLELPSESYLCDFCKRLDIQLKSFIVHPDDNEHQRANKFAYLGRLSQVRQRIHCPFCRLVIHIADRPSDQRAPSKSQLDDDPATYARWVVDGQDEEEQNGRPVYQGKTRRVLVYSQPQAFKDGYVVLLADDAPFREYFGRVVPSSDLLDPDQLRHWLSDCERTHGKACDQSLVHPDLMLDLKDTLRAIDVDQMCITEMPPDARYCALSYLWGKKFQQLFTTSENLARLSKPDALTKEKLPRTIKDSIKLCRMLGERYLWTDSLALVHDEGFQYHDDWVYARATLTLVAASGKDANAGLPGVRLESRAFHQEIETIRPGLRLMVAHLAEDYISTSQWDSRAWTYQERMLSRRCLIFSNGRIYFQCRRATYCEDIEMPAKRGWSLNSMDMPTRIFDQPAFVQFTSAVELYTQREMTNPNDILNAFEGVKLVLEKRIRSGIFFGMVENMIDSSIIWESSKRLRHRLNFPTWSWAGWTAEIQWKLAEYAESWIEWYDDSEESTSFPAQKRNRIGPPIPRPVSLRAVPSRSQLEGAMPRLRFTTISASFMLLRPAPIHKEAVSPLRKRMTGPSALSTVRPSPTDPGLVRAGIADRYGEWVGTIDLDNGYMKMVDIPFEFLLMSRVSGFTEDEQINWEGLLPDVIEDEMARRDYGVYNVLLVSERDGVHYRQGLGRILTSCLERALKPGPIWRNIVLG